MLLMSSLLVDDSPASDHGQVMGRPKQFTERIQLPLAEGTTARIDDLLFEGEFRLDFIRAAIESELARRSARRAKAQSAGDAKGNN